MSTVNSPAQDLTQGPILPHLLRLAAPIAIGMLFQNLYHLIDLYFVAQLGDDAIAGVSAAGNLAFVVLALTQMLSVGSVALMAQAAGRRDRDDAQRLFQQSLMLSFLLFGATLVFGYLLSGRYLAGLAASAAVREAGSTYLIWFLPCLALQFITVALGSAMRAFGVVKPAMLVQLLTIVLNILFAPILIAGWGTGVAFGVAGAGAASSLALLIGLGVLLRMFKRLDLPLTLSLRPVAMQWPVIGRLLRVGAPAGGEFLLIFVYMGLIYWLIKPFGADAQAGFGIAQRVMQALFLPAIAISFALSPLAAQNVGANLPQRVRDAFRQAVLLSAGLMLILTAVCQWRADVLLRLFSDDAAVLAVGSDFLHVVAWNFIATGLIFTCSSVFQALGHTLPSLLSSASRLITFALPAFWLSTRPGFSLQQLWWLSVTTVTLQALLSIWLLRGEMRARLQPMVAS